MSAARPSRTGSRSTTHLKENTDPSSYDQVFQQQLDSIKDKVPTETYQKLKRLNWGNYIASQLRKSNFHDDIDDHLQHIVTKLLVQPGQLFRGYNPDRHGPLDRRFGASVRNEIAKLIQKTANRRKSVPPVPLDSFDRAVHQDQSQAFTRDEIMAKVGELGVAVYDCILAGVSPSVLVGRVELGSPSSYRVRKVKRELEQEAKAAALRRAGVQAVEACGASQAATLQTGTACEDRDAEAESESAALSLPFQNGLAIWIVGNV